MDNLIWHSETTPYKSQRNITNFFINIILNFYDLCKRKDKMNKKQVEFSCSLFPVPRSSLMNPMLRIVLSRLTEFSP